MGNGILYRSVRDSFEILGYLTPAIISIRKQNYKATLQSRPFRDEVVRDVPGGDDHGLIAILGFTLAANKIYHLFGDILGDS